MASGFISGLIVAFRLLTKSACSGFSSQALDPCTVVLPLIAIPHFAEQELSFELFARQFLDELNQAGFCLHEGFEPGVDFGVEFELANQSSLFFGDAITIGPAFLRH